MKSNLEFFFRKKNTTNEIIYVHKFAVKNIIILNIAIVS